MMERLVEDYLRDEYNSILPILIKIKMNLEADINKQILPVANNLKAYERVSVVARVKSMESAIEKLKSNQEGKIFQQKSPESYSLNYLKDLVGLRVLYFPGTLKSKLQNTIKKKYRSWKYEPVMDFKKDEKVIIDKYYGNIEIEEDITCEIQLMPMLYSRFLDVEHDIIYKPDPKYKGMQRSLELKNEKNQVLLQLQNMEKAFCELVNQYEEINKLKKKTKGTFGANNKDIII